MMRMFWGDGVCTDGNNTKKKQAADQRRKIAQAIHEAGGSVDEQRSVVQKVARALGEIVDGKSVNIRRGLMKQVTKFKQQALGSSAPVAPAAPAAPLVPKEETAPAAAPVDTAAVSEQTVTEKTTVPEPPQPHDKEDDDGLKYPPLSPAAQQM